MIPIAFDEENAYLDVPPDAGNNVEPMPVHRRLIVDRVVDGEEFCVPELICCWKVESREELDEILRTGLVWLVIRAPTTYPVSVQGISPFEKENSDELPEKR